MTTKYSSALTSKVGAVVTSLLLIIFTSLLGRIYTKVDAIDALSGDLKEIKSSMSGIVDVNKQQSEQLKELVKNQEDLKDKLYQHIIDNYEQNAIKTRASKGN